MTERSEFTAVFLDNVQYLEYPRFCIGTVLTSELRSDKSTKSHCVHVLHVAMLVCTEVTHANYSSSSLSVSWRLHGARMHGHARECTVHRSGNLSPNQCRQAIMEFAVKSSGHEHSGGGLPTPPHHISNSACLYYLTCLYGP